MVVKFCCASSYFRLTFVFRSLMLKMVGSLSLFSEVTAVSIFGSVWLKSCNAYGWFWLSVDRIFFLVLYYFCECFDLYCQNQLRASWCCVHCSTVNQI